MSRWRSESVTTLSRLQRLPFDELKIDRSFVMRMASSESDLAIVRSTIDLARNLGLRVVAEGVEDDDTLGRLEALGCDAVQGYLIGMPAPAAELWADSTPAPTTGSAAFLAAPRAPAPW